MCQLAAEYYVMALLLIIALDGDLDPTNGGIDFKSIAGSKNMITCFFFFFLITIVITILM